MKAKIIKTGEIVDVYHEPQHGQITNIYKESVLVNGRMWTENELDFCIKTNKAPEKIYVNNYSSGLTYNWHNERLAVNDIEYIRTDAFIEKACEFLQDRIEHDSIDYPMATHWLINDFRNYMKGE